MDENQKSGLRMRFINGEQIDTNEIRPEILESWRRCKGKVDPFKKKNTDILNGTDLEALRLEYKELIDITVPVMKNLYEIMNDEGFVIILFAGNGGNQYILEIIGDEKAMRHSHCVNVIPGSSWAESVMGTNAGCLAFLHDRPFQVYPYENYCLFMKCNTSSAAPIHDPDTNAIIGVLCIAGNLKMVHCHTLGMITVLVSLIEKQIAAVRLKNKAEIENNYKNLIMEAYSGGLIAIDENLVITQVNQKAISTLEIEENPLGKNIISLFSNVLGAVNRPRELIDIIRSNNDVSDEFIHFHAASKTIRCAVTTRSIYYNHRVIGKIIMIQKMSRVNNLLARTVGNSARFTFSDLIGENKKFLYAMETALQVSNTGSNILLLGESGTGKDLIAQSIHNASGRSGQPYIVINCAAIPRELLGSELFGYMEGAFTGARKGGNPGKFELADGGTIFLDEIGEMPLDMQTVFLRVLEERAVTRIGGKKAIPVDVRVIAATNKNLAKEVEKGNFREDMYYRLNVVSIYLPPLRERREDVPLLITHLVDKTSKRLGKKIKSIDQEFMLACSAYEWPGNVRELQNTVERCINLARSSVLTLSLLPDNILKHNTSVNNLMGPDRSLKKYGKSVESSLIKEYLHKYGGNINLVARELGISRSTLYRRLKNKLN